MYTHNMTWPVYDMTRPLSVYLVIVPHLLNSVDIPLHKLGSGIYKVCISHLEPDLGIFRQFSISFQWIILHVLFIVSVKFRKLGALLL